MGCLRAALMYVIVLNMDTFGIIFALPVAIVISIFYPQFILRLFSKNRVLVLTFCGLSCLVVIAICVEIGLITHYGIVTAHDKYHPNLDRLHGWNSLLGPAAVTNLFIAFLLYKKSPTHIIKLVSGFVCFLAIGFMGVSNLFYDNAAHYRTRKALIAFKSKLQSNNKQPNKALHPTAYSFVRRSSSLRFQRRVSLVVMPRRAT